jgi:hypothetical protein
MMTMPPTETTQAQKNTAQHRSRGTVSAAIEFIREEAYRHGFRGGYQEIAPA